MYTSHAELSVVSAGGRDEGRPEFFRIGLTDSN